MFVVSEIEQMDKTRAVSASGFVCFLCGILTGTIGGHKRGRLFSFSILLFIVSLTIVVTKT